MSTNQKKENNNRNFFNQVNRWISDILDDTWEIAVDVSTANWKDNNIKLHMLNDKEIDECVRVLNNTNYII